MPLLPRKYVNEAFIFKEVMGILQRVYLVAANTKLSDVSVRVATAPSEQNQAAFL